MKLEFTWRPVPDSDFTVIWQIVIIAYAASYLAPVNQKKPGCGIGLVVKLRFDGLGVRNPNS